MTAEERHAFVMAVCNGTAVLSSRVPDNLLAMVFMPLALGALAGWPKRDLAKIGLVWADQARDTMVPGRAVNGYPMFVACRLMLRVDWDELRPACNAEIDRRKAVKA